MLCQGSHLFMSRNLKFIQGMEQVVRDKLEKESRKGRILDPFFE